MSGATISVDYHTGKENVISGSITTGSWEGASGEPYAVLHIGPITLFTPSGADPPGPSLWRCVMRSTG